MSTEEVRVRLVDLFRNPFTEGTEKLTNVTAIDATIGLYRLTNVAGPILIVAPPGIDLDRELRIGVGAPAGEAAVEVSVEVAVGGGFGA